LRRRRKGGAERNALGRSRGGHSTKINARTNAEGLPIGTRYDKLTESFAAFVLLASIRIWIRFVHAT
jgi:hypothetical protein